ncbi:APC family permease [Streptomyces sp. NPDC000878]
MQNAHKGSAEDADERRRLSTLDLVGLAAGGVVGSGWLMSASKTYETAGDNAYWAWVIGGALMLLIAVVMVELGIAAPKTGGLIFLPLQAAGPLLATVVAAALWIAYAANPASQAAAAVVHGLKDLLPGEEVLGDHLSAIGQLYAVVLLALIVGVNLLPTRQLLRLNLVITAVKILILVLIVAFLSVDWLDRFVPHPGNAVCLKDPKTDPAQLLPTVLGGAVIYAYIGFQAPLDCAGNVKRRGMSEAARLRWAVYGSIVGAFLLYTALQYVYIKHSHVPGAWDPDPYAKFAGQAHLGWLARLVQFNAVLAPLGSGIVFTYALTREVAALSRAHLTHRGLQRARRASIRIRGAEIDTYWMILLVNFAVSLTLLAVVKGNWKTLAALNSGLTLTVYAMAGVVLAALPSTTPPGTRRKAQLLLSYAAFIATTVVIHQAGWDKVWPGMAALGTGSVLLLVLPALARSHLPFVGHLLRRYDARDHLFRTNLDDGALPPLLLFLAHLEVLLVCTGLGDPGKADWTMWATVLSATLVFPLLVLSARDHMAQVPPLLPSPRHELPVKSSVTEGS